MGALVIMVVVCAPLVPVWWVVDARATRRHARAHGRRCHCGGKWDL